MLICDYCGKKRENFSSSRVFLNHYRDHKGEEYNCGQCDKTFSTKQNLRYHNVKMHCNQNFKCDQCAKEFTCEVSLKRHVKDIHEKRDSMKEKCQHCNKKIRKDNLKKHNESCSRKYFDDSKNKLYMNVLLAEKSGNGTL